jgi:tyrosyl-tRNA synthetase
MSLPDGVIDDYFTLATRVPAEELEEMRQQLQQRSVNPMELKKRLAREIVGQYYGPSAAEAAEQEFTHVIQKRTSDKVGVREEVTIGVQVPFSSLDSYGSDLMALLLAKGLVQSRGDARRLMSQGAIDVDGSPVSDFNVDLRPGTVIRVKHRFLRIVD